MKKLLQFELQKIFFRRLTQVALVALLLLSVLLNVSSYRNKHAFDGSSCEGRGGAAVAIDKRIAAKYEGILTDEKVQQMLCDFAPTQDLHGLNAAYLYQNATQSAAFARFSDKDGNWNGRLVSDVFSGMEIKIGYVDGWLSTVQNMAKIILALSVVIIVMTAPVFCGEYGGVDQIILTSKYGRTKAASAKVAASILAALFIAALAAAGNYLFAFILYGKEGLDCSILFAPMGFVEGFIPFNITCGTLLAYQLLLAFTGVLSVAGVTMLLSSVSKDSITVLASSAAVYFLPAMLPISEASPLFKLVCLLPLYHAQFISLMSVAQGSGGTLYAVWAVPAALVLLSAGAIVSRRVFASHQVS